MSAQLELVLQLREKAEKEARENMQRVESQRDALKNQILQLEEFVRDYQRQFSDPNTITSMQKRFLLMIYVEQIQTAIAGHQSKLESYELSVDQLRQIWLETRQQKLGFERLLEKRQQESRQYQEKMEQKQLDDFVSTRQYHTTS